MGPPGATGTQGPQGQQGPPGSDAPAFVVSGTVSQASPLNAVHNWDTFDVVAAAYVTSDNGATYTQVATGLASATQLGDGRDGALTVSGLQRIDQTRTSATGTSGANTLTVTSITGFSTGDIVLILQMRGPGAGQWEEHTVTGLGGTTLTLDAPLSASYSNSGVSRSVAVRVPQYTNVTVNAGATLTASAWDGTTGGVLALRARDTVLIQPGGMIDVSGLGYLGGVSNGTVQPYTVATGGPFAGESPTGPSIRSPISLVNTIYTAAPNGGGGAGGVNANYEGMTGGHGGAHASPGSLGTAANVLSPQTLRSASYGDDELRLLFMGSGGGGGGNHYIVNGAATQPPGYGVGGSGGGIAFLRASTFTNQGLVSANGGSGTLSYLAAYNNCSYIAGGGGGGGAGGSVRIEALAGYAGTLTVVGGSGGQGRTSCYDGWTSATTGGNGGDGRTRVSLGGGFTLMMPDRNTVRLLSSGSTAKVKIVVKR